MRLLQVTHGREGGDLYRTSHHGILVGTKPDMIELARTILAHLAPDRLQTQNTHTEETP